MNNIQKLKDIVGSQEFDALMVSAPPNRRFATAFNSSAGILLVTADNAWFFTDSRYEEAAKLSIKNANVSLITKDIPYTQAINSVIEKSKIKSIGFEDEAVTYSEYLSWSKKLTAKLVPAGTLVSKLRTVKSKPDLEIMIRAQRISEKSFEEIIPLVNTGITERELANELMCRFLKNGADDKSFDPIIVSGPRTSMPHGVPGGNKIGPGFVTIDFGVKLDGWCSDTTRTLCVGTPAPEMIKVYETVLKAQQKGIETVRAGVQCRDVDGAARSVITDAGYGSYFGHGFGHGLGLEVHEHPTVSAISDTILEEGAVISAEPGIYLPGKFGVRIEDVLFVTADGSINITNLPKELIVL